MGMEAIIFVGIQAVGKSTFYQQRLFKTHVRISLDMLKTRHREDIFLRACIDAQQSFVVDNTNPTIEERRKYIELARANRFRIIGYYFQSSVADALKRNAFREDKSRIPDLGILGTFKRLQLPVYAEGFDELYFVKIGTADEFIVSAWDEK